MRDEDLATMPTGTTTTPPAPPAPRSPTPAIDLSPIFNVPGVVWIALIGAVTKWVSDSFPDQPWAPAVVIGLGAAAKLIQMYWPKPAPAPEEATSAQPGPAAAPITLDSGDYTWSAARPRQQPESAGRKFARLLIG